MTTTPLYISPKGGSITCLRGDTGRIFRSCSSSRCIYSTDLHAAKLYLDNLEFRKSIPAVHRIDILHQPKLH